MLLDKASLAVRSIASTDPFRHELTGIQVLPDGTTIATNGHVLVSMKPCAVPEDVAVIDGQLGDDKPEKAVILPREFMDKVGKDLPKAKKGMPANLSRVTFEEGKVHSGISVPGSMDTVVSTKVIEGTFPEVEQIFPTDDPVMTISFNVKYLVEMSKILNEVTTNKDQVTIEIRAAKEPGRHPVAMVVRCVESVDDERFYGILMPVRNPKKD